MLTSADLVCKFCSTLNIVALTLWGNSLIKGYDTHNITVCQSCIIQLYLSLEQLQHQKSSGRYPEYSLLSWHPVSASYATHPEGAEWKMGGRGDEEKEVAMNWERAYGAKSDK